MRKKRNKKSWLFPPPRDGAGDTHSCSREKKETKQNFSLKSLISRQNEGGSARSGVWRRRYRIQGHDGTCGIGVLTFFRRINGGTKER